MTDEQIRMNVVLFDSKFIGLYVFFATIVFLRTVFVIYVICPPMRPSIGPTNTQLPSAQIISTRKLPSSSIINHTIISDTKERILSNIPDGRDSESKRDLKSKAMDEYQHKLHRDRKADEVLVMDHSFEKIQQITQVNVERDPIPPEKIRDRQSDSSIQVSTCDPTKGTDFRRARNEVTKSKKIEVWGLNAVSNPMEESFRGSENEISLKPDSTSCSIASKSQRSCDEGEDSASNSMNPILLGSENGISLNPDSISLSVASKSQRNRDGAENAVSNPMDESFMMSLNTNPLKPDLTSLSVDSNVTSNERSNFPNENTNSILNLGISSAVCKESKDLASLGGQTSGVENVASRGKLVESPNPQNHPNSSKNNNIGIATYLASLFRHFTKSIKISRGNSGTKHRTPAFQTEHHEDTMNRTKEDTLRGESADLGGRDTGRSIDNLGTFHERTTKTDSKKTGIQLATPQKRAVSTQTNEYQTLKNAQYIILTDKSSENGKTCDTKARDSDQIAYISTFTVLMRQRDGETLHNAPIEAPIGMYIDKSVTLDECKEVVVSRRPGGGTLEDIPEIEIQECRNNAQFSVPSRQLTNQDAISDNKSAHTSSKQQNRSCVGDSSGHQEDVIRSDRKQQDFRSSTLRLTGPIQTVREQANRTAIRADDDNTVAQTQESGSVVLDTEYSRKSNSEDLHLDLAANIQKVNEKPPVTSQTYLDKAVYSVPKGVSDTLAGFFEDPHKNQNREDRRRQRSSFERLGRAESVGYQRAPVGLRNDKDGEDSNEGSAPDDRASVLSWSKDTSTVEFDPGKYRGSANHENAQTTAILEGVVIDDEKFHHGNGQVYDAKRPQLKNRNAPSEYPETQNPFLQPSEKLHSGNRRPEIVESESKKHVTFALNNEATGIDGPRATVRKQNHVSAKNEEFRALTDMTQKSDDVTIRRNTRINDPPKPTVNYGDQTKDVFRHVAGDNRPKIKHDPPTGYLKRIRSVLCDGRAETRLTIPIPSQSEGIMMNISDESGTFGSKKVENRRSIRYRLKDIITKSIRSCKYDPDTSAPKNVDTTSTTSGGSESLRGVNDEANHIADSNDNINTMRINSCKSVFDQNKTGNAVLTTDTLDESGAFVDKKFKNGRSARHRFRNILSRLNLGRKPETDSVHAENIEETILNRSREQQIGSGCVENADETEDTEDFQSAYQGSLIQEVFSDPIFANKYREFWASYNFKEITGILALDCQREDQDQNPRGMNLKDAEEGIYNVDFSQTSETQDIEAMCAALKYNSIPSERTSIDAADIHAGIPNPAVNLKNDCPEEKTTANDSMSDVLTRMDTDQSCDSKTTVPDQSRCSSPSSHNMDSVTLSNSKYIQPKDLNRTGPNADIKQPSKPLTSTHDHQDYSHRNISDSITPGQITKPRIRKNEVFGGLLHENSVDTRSKLATEKLSSRRQEQHFSVPYKPIPRGKPRKPSGLTSFLDEIFEWLFWTASL